MQANEDLPRVGFSGPRETKKVGLLHQDWHEELRIEDLLVRQDHRLPHKNAKHGSVEKHAKCAEGTCSPPGRVVATVSWHCS